MNCKIKLRAKKQCDVFVMGAGIAGVTSAIEASNKGAKVIISSTANIFSGSSFYPGTWGLGLIGPTDKHDEEDLIKTITEVGCNVTDKNIVKKFVENINPSIDYLKNMNVKLKEAVNKNEKEFVPCFDYKERNWNGIIFDSAKEVLGKALKKNQVVEYPFSEVIDIVLEDNKVIGVILINEINEIEFIKCKALIIASGGMGGLFKYSLNTADITSMGQALALKSGCKLTNIEFMQMMPGYINPRYKTIFNERTFKYIEARNQDGENIFKNIEDLEMRLDERSTHGPFTTRLNSREIDYAIFNEFIKNSKGVKVKYKEEIKNNKPEFIKVYFDWLEKNKKLSIDDEINIGIFFHASNGGIVINENAETEVQGLFAAGECTGGMHGADRIGGLSTANGLVFGKIAGESSYNYSKNNEVSKKEEIDFELYEINEVDKLIEELQEIMFENVMIKKNDMGIKKAFLSVENIINKINYNEKTNMENVKKTYRLQANILLAKAVLKAVNIRKESRGSHYRNDYPHINSNMNERIIIEFNNDIKVYFLEG